MPLCSSEDDEVQHFHGAVAADVAELGEKARGRVLVGEVLQDHLHLGQRAVLGFQRGHIALAVDAEEILARLGFLGPQVNLFGAVGEAQFVEGDVRRKRAGAGGIVELHACLL
jgi:hypothetical protein